MYGKTFESIYQGSMVGAGLNVFAVWSYIITMTHFGAIELNPKLLAFMLGGEEKEIVAALEYLERPDPQSRTKAEDGRRIVREGQFQYRVVNWELYQSIRNEAQRREYNRIKQAEHRAKKKVKKNVPSARERKFEEAVQAGDEAEASRLTDNQRADSSAA